MGNWTQILLALAISIDVFSVGFSYGLREIKLGIIPLILIGFLSAAAIFISLYAGSFLAAYLSARMGEIIGGFMLVGVGSWLFYSGRKKVEYEMKNIDEIRLNSFEQILQKPDQVDFDSSGSINCLEAVVLGIALAVDALGVGLGAGFTGAQIIFFPVIIGFLTLFFFLSGYYLAKNFKETFTLPIWIEYLPGIIIVLLGLFRIF